MVFLYKILKIVTFKWIAQEHNLGSIRHACRLGDLPASLGEQYLNVKRLEIHNFEKIKRRFSRG